MLRILQCIIWLLLTLSFESDALSLAPSNPIVIKFSHVVDPDTPKGQMAHTFQQLVAQRLAGKVIVRVYPNSQLFTDDAVLPAIQRGEVEMAAPSLSKFKPYTDKLQLFDLPFLFDSAEAVEHFQNSQPGKQLLHSFQDSHLIGLGYLHNGMKQLSANTPILEPQDMRGKTFRIMNSDVLQAQFSAVDAQVLRKPFSQVFTLLQTRQVDGQENTWSNIYSQQLHEVQNYITETNHGVLDYVVVSSTDFWNSLPKPIRLTLEGALQEAIQQGNRIAREKAQQDKDNITQAGKAELLTLSEHQRRQWRTRMQPVWQQFEPQIGRHLIDAAQKANADTRRRHQNQ